MKSNLYKFQISTNPARKKVDPLFNTEPCELDTFKWYPFPIKTAYPNEVSFIHPNSICMYDCTDTLFSYLTKEVIDNYLDDSHSESIPQLVEIINNEENYNSLKTVVELIRQIPKSGVAPLLYDIGSGVSIMHISVFHPNQLLDEHDQLTLIALWYLFQTQYKDHQTHIPIVISGITDYFPREFRTNYVLAAE